MKPSRNLPETSTKTLQYARADPLLNLPAQILLQTLNQELLPERTASSLSVLRSHPKMFNPPAQNDAKTNTKMLMEIPFPSMYSKSPGAKGEIFEQRHSMH